MASLGAKVLQTRSVELAMKHGVRLQVLSSFDDVPGTLVVDEEEIVEQELVSGIAYSRDEAKITLLRVADRPGVAAGDLRPAGRRQHQRRHDRAEHLRTGGDTTDLTFTVSEADLERAVAVLDASTRDASATPTLQSDPNVVKVSVIGVGMRSHAGIAQRMFRDAGREGHQHPGDLDLGDQGQRSDRRGIHRTGRARAAHRLRPGRAPEMTTEPARRREDRARPAVAARPRVPRLSSYAIMGGAMSWVSERHLVAAISNAGGFGVIACGSLSPDQLRDEIAGAAGADQPPVRRQSDHHASAARRADRGLPRRARSAMSCSPAACRRCRDPRASRMAAPR